MKAEKYKIITTYQKSARLDSDLSYKFFKQLIIHESYIDLLNKVSNYYQATGQRFCTLTGPYGSGKSTFAILLAGLLSKDKKIRSTAENTLPKRTLTKFKKAFKNEKGWLVVRIVSGGENFIFEMHKSLKSAVKEFWGNKIPKEIRNLSKPKTSNDLIKQIKKVSSQVEKSDSGVAIIFDEFGKALEDAEKNHNNIFIFQELSEILNRADVIKKNEEQPPILFLGILHQAIQEYAKNSSDTVKKEWDKISHRYVDLPFSLGIEEVVKLINNAIDGPEYPRNFKKTCSDTVATLEVGRLQSMRNLDSDLAGCHPLHPITALLLGPISKRRFGQNERSTFGFLTSQEPYGFKFFLTDMIHKQETFSPDILWDYLQQNLEPAIMLSSDGHKWSEASISINRIKDDLIEHKKILKSISIISLFGKKYGIKANEETLVLIYGLPKKRIETILKDLVSKRSIVRKNYSNSYEIFEGSDIDLDEEIDKIKTDLENSDNYLDKIPLDDLIIAKRHYHETGTLRWLDRRLCDSKQLEEKLTNWQSLKGEIGSFFLCPDQINKQNSFESKNHVVGYSDNYNSLIDVSQSLYLLNKVKEETDALLGDKVARKELDVRIDETNSRLQSITNLCFDEATWFFRGKEISGKNLSQIASDVANSIYNKSPKIFNELINREKPASQAMAARKRLMYGLISNQYNRFEESDYDNEKENLGIEKFPAELGLYLTLIKNKLHKRDPKLKIWKFIKPKDKEIQNLWKAGEEFLDSCRQSKKPLGDLYKKWKEPPYGIKEGVLPIYALLFMLTNEKKAGFYHKDIYQSNLGPIFVEHLTHSPDNISIRSFDIEGIDAATMQQYSKLLSDESLKLKLKNDPTKDPLNAAKPIAKFCVNLPKYTKQTKSLGKLTRDIRDKILKASDPIDLLQDDLKKVCGLSYDQKVNDEMIKKLTKAFKEMQACYPNLIEKLKKGFFVAFNLRGTNDIAKIKSLSKRASIVLDARVRGNDSDFTNKLNILKRAESSDEWVDVLAGMLTTENRVIYWSDSTVDNFEVKLLNFAEDFKQAENQAKKIEPLSKEEREICDELTTGLEDLLGDKPLKIKERSLIDILDKIRN